MTLLQKLQSLLTAANARTAANDSTLTAAVQTLIAGYGTGQAPVLPAGYTRMEYIEGSGTQYIDTGMEIDDTSVSVVLDFWSTAQSYGNVLGGTNILVQASGSSFLNYRLNGGSLYAIKSISSKECILHLSRAEIYGEDFRRNVQSVIPDQTAFDSVSSSVYLFASNNNGNPERICSGRFYGLTVSLGNTVTHQFVPVMRDIDSVLGIYDLIGGQFCTNIGSGSLIGGALS